MKTVVGRDVCSRAASPLKWLGFFVDAVAAKLLVTVSSKAIGVEGSSRRCRRRCCLVVFVRWCCVVVVLLLSSTLHALSLSSSLTTNEMTRQRGYKSFSRKCTMNTLSFLFLSTLSRHQNAMDKNFDYH